MRQVYRAKRNNGCGYAFKGRQVSTSRGDSTGNADLLFRHSFLRDLFKTVETALRRGHDQIAIGISPGILTGHRPQTSRVRDYQRGIDTLTQELRGDTHVYRRALYERLTTSPPEWRQPVVEPSRASVNQYDDFVDSTIYGNSRSQVNWQEETNED